MGIRKGKTRRVILRLSAKAFRAKPGYADYMDLPTVYNRAENEMQNAARSILHFAGKASR
jgi:hypothetical protein